MRITRELIRQKLTGQELVARNKLLDPTTADAIAGFRTELSIRDGIAEIYSASAQVGFCA